MLEQIKKGIFTTDSRISRLPFFIIFVVCFVINFLIILILPNIFDINNPQYGNYIFLLKIPAMAFTLIASVNRFHDMNKSGWYILLGLVPLFGRIILPIWLIFGKGTIGENDFGEDPLDLNNNLEDNISNYSE